MSYESWRISYQSSEQAAQAAYAQLQAVSAAAKALSEATNERDADDAQERLDAAIGGQLEKAIALNNLHAAQHAMQQYAEACKTNHHPGETFGMSVSGPTGCASAPHCLRAARLVFLDAARLIEHRIEEAKQETTPCPPR